MKKIICLTALLLGGCGTVPPCETKSIKLQAPSGIPFIGNAPFVLERSNMHVDCARDPDDRNINE